MFHRLLTPPTHSFFLFGPRGTGKSTWIREHFSGVPVYDLLRADEALRLSKDPSLIRHEQGSLRRGAWVVVDEVQKVPALLDEVHGLIEERGLRFVLSGSSARKLKREGANLLSGRARVERMFPLVSAEIGALFDPRRAVLCGLLPIAVSDPDPAAFLRAYAEVYLQEEIRAEALTRNIGGFARFLEVAARQNGQITNVSNIARDAQVARQTVQGYFELLIDTLIGTWLPAWKLKRSTKQIAHPKFYFFDSGVARTLSGRLAYAPSSEEMGPQVETLMLHEMRAFLGYKRLGYSPYYWSSPSGVEVDILLEDARGFLALEIKSTTRWERRFNRGLLRVAEELRIPRGRRLGVYLGARPAVVEDVTVLPVAEFLGRLWAGDLVR